MMKSHESFMRRALDLAMMGAGNVAPNPMVGCVIVHDEKIIGEGYHAFYGGAHAEVNAIESVQDKSLLQKSTLYVTLEPCAHWGKTPPCADFIIQHQIPHVVIASNDPFEQVDGKGIHKLEIAGIKVETGMLDKENKWLNRRFFEFHQNKKPYVILKWAQSKDQFIAELKNGIPQKTSISNEVTNQLNHHWRSLESAILVGYNTALTDNPELTARMTSGKNPIRIIVDKKLELPKDLKVFSQASSSTIVFNEKENSTRGNLKLIKIDFNKAEEEILTQLYLNNIQSVIIEGGTKTLNGFIHKRLWDEARVITSPKEITEGYPAPIFDCLSQEEFKSGSDNISIYYKNIK